jgi:hypothetical protein
MNSYRLLKNQFENIVPAVKTNEFVPPVYDFKGGDFKYNYYLTQNDSLGFDFKDIKSMLKYWTDNSGNIVSSNEFEKM